MSRGYRLAAFQTKEALFLVGAAVQPYGDPIAGQPMPQLGGERIAIDRGSSRRLDDNFQPKGSDRGEGGRTQQGQARQGRVPPGSHFGMNTRDFLDCP